MFCEAAPDGDWALADDQMLDRQIAAKVIRREKTILLPLFRSSGLLLLEGPSEHIGSQRQPFWLYLKDQNSKVWGDNSTVGAVGPATLATLTFASWNQIHQWLRRLHALRNAA